jgi:gliding motility-associated-like protein
MSKEPEFKDFEIYRYKKGILSKPGMPFMITKDTFLRDSSFDVDAESYCYEIIVTDKCGHISNASNPGCNVVIKGNSKYWPDPYFDLEWDDYRGWENGVSSWILERKHEGNTNFGFLGSIGNNRTYRDQNLDYDWGGYSFRVIGREAVQSGQIDYNATTESNWIYLIQPPEVWVPDAFTVNDDGINENWGTFPLFVKNYSMKVYYRWGNKIWESTAKKQQWDGLYNGKQVPDGVYAWLLTFDGWSEGVFQKTGTVLVVH